MGTRPAPVTRGIALVAIFLFCVFSGSFQATPVMGDIFVQSLVTDGQGILPNSGPVEIFGVNAYRTTKIVSDLANIGGGFVSPISISYDFTDPDEIWLIQCIGIETSSDGVAGTFRFAVARSQESDHPRYPLLEPITDISVWQRQANPECGKIPPPDVCLVWPYVDARVGPAAGPGLEYVWNFTVPNGNSGTIRLRLNLCGGSAGSGFETGDRFFIDMADKDVLELTSFRFRISNVRDEEDVPDFDVRPEDFDSFGLFADAAGGRNGIFDPGYDYEIPSSWYISWDDRESFEVVVSIMGSAPVPASDSSGYAGDDYFVVLQTSDTIDSGCCTCPKVNPIDDFTCTLDPEALEFDGGQYSAPHICSPLETGAIVCESLALDILQIPQGPPYLCADLLNITYPGSLTDLPRGIQRYQYYAPDLTIRPKYSAEYQLLSGITADSFDVIYKGPDDPSVDVPSFFEIPEVTPLERRFGVIALDIAGGTSNNPEYLNVINLTLANTMGDFEFDPREHLDDLRTLYPYFSGLSIYEDTNDNGIWDEVSYDPQTFNPIYGTGDLPLDIFWTEFETADFSTYNIQLWLDAPPPIDLLADRQPDYFVVLRADSGLSDDSPFSRDGKGMNQGANFSTAIEPPFAVSFRRAFPDQGLKTYMARPSFSALSGQDYSMFFGYDINPLGIPIQQAIDAQSPPTPILAFNAACSDVPQTGLVADPIRFQSIRIQFDGAGTGFDPEDIEEIYIYRDDKSPYFDFPRRNIGVFDVMNDMANWMPPGRPLDAMTNPAEESPVPLNEYQIMPDGAGNYEAILAPRAGMQYYPKDKIESEASIDTFTDNFVTNQDGLPENVIFSGSDYFICVKTSDKIAYRDIIRPVIPIGGVFSSTGPTVLKTEDFVHPEDPEGRVSELIANVPVILEDLVRARRGLNPVLGANESDVELIGINAFTNYPVGGEEVYLEQLIVQFIEAASRLSPNFNLGENGDLLPYQDRNGDDTVSSGIKVWRVIGGERYLVKFADTDHSPYTFLDNPSLVASSDAPNQAILMVFNPDDTSSLGGTAYSVQELLRIPETDEEPYAGNDFIITISTSTNFDMKQDNFSVALISWGPDSPGAPKPYHVLNGATPPEYPPIPPAFSFASSSALLYYQNYPEAARGIGFIDSNEVHSRSFKTINTSAFNASVATRLQAVGNFAATLNDARVSDRTRQVVLTWVDTNTAGPGTVNESGYWIESDMFGRYQALPQNPLPAGTQLLFFNGPRFLAGRTVNFRINPFQEGLNPGAKYPPMNGIGPVATTSVTFDVSVIPIIPTADFSASPLSGCVPLEVCFVDASLDDPTSWFWDFGDGATSSQQNPCHIYAESGNYTVRLTVANDNGSHAVARYNYVHVEGVPAPEFDADQYFICAGQSIAFTDLTGGFPSSWEWDFGDGSPVSTLQNPTHLYTAPGTYDVTLTAANSCGSGSLTKSAFVVVNEGVLAQFSADVLGGCSPITVQFTNESLCEPAACLWDFGDGTTSAEYNPVHLYATAGLHTVSLTVTKGVDISTETKSDYIAIDSIVGDFEIATVQGCGVKNIRFTDLSTCNPTQWTWDFGDGSLVSNEQHPLHAYENCGTYDVTLTSGDGYSSDTITKTGVVTILTQPTADFESDLTLACAGQSVQFTDLSSCEPVAWLWDFGDGTISTEMDPSHAYGTLGQFTVTLTAINGCGNQVVTKPNHITVQGIPAANFSVDATEGCAPLAVRFTDLSVGSIDFWEWDFGDGSPPVREQNPTHIYAAGGTYSVALTVGNSCGSSSFALAAPITVSDGIAAVFDANVTAGCIPLAVQFINGSPCNPTACLWDFGDGTTSSEYSPTHQYTASGTYTVSLTVSKAGEPDSTETKEAYITVDPLAPSFGIGTTEGCAPLSVQFTDTSLCPATTWTWDFGDGTPSGTGQNPVHIYDTCGVFDVTLTVSNAYASETITYTSAVTVTKQPAAEFSTDKTFACPGEDIVFTDLSTCDPAEWLWNFGDGATSTEMNPTHAYATAGVYSVSLTTTNSCGSNTVTKSALITVGAFAVAAFSADSTDGCVPFTVHFTDTSTGEPVSWEWDFGDGSPVSIERNPTHIYTAGGVYTVTLTVTNACGPATEVKYDYVVVREVVAAEFDYGSNHVCKGTSVPFYSLATGEPTSWEWDFGDGTPKSTETNPLHVYAATGDYTVTLTVSNGCSTAAISHVVPIKIFTEAHAEFSFSPPTGCAPLEICFTNASWGEPTDLLWEFGDGTSSGEQSPCHTYAEPGVYSICLYVSNPCGLHSVCKEITVYGEPRADFEANVTVGEVPLTVCFTDTSAGGNINVWQWQFGDGGRSTEKNPCHIYTKAGNYTVTLGVSSPCGTSTFSIPDAVSVYDKINLLSPSDGAYLQSPPTFRWSGSINNRFRVEYSYDPAFRVLLASTPIVSVSSFTVPLPVWDRVPVYKKIYWRVRGADANVTPLEIHESQTWTFWRY